MADTDNEFAVFTQVLEYLFVTGVDGITKENIEQQKITHIINVSIEAKTTEFPGVKTISIPLHDDPKEDMSGYLDKVADDIEQFRLNGGRIVVHCVAGCSRSVTFILAYLMKYKDMTLKEAFEWVKAKRPLVKPNNGFWAQLVNYEKGIRGTNSIQMVPIYGLDGHTHKIPDIFANDGYIFK